MTTRAKIILALAILTGVVAGGLLWWHALMEPGWTAIMRTPEEMHKNKMHVATLLLRQRGHGVTVAGTLGETAIGTLPDGTLLMADHFGSLSQDKAEQLLAWVRRGNTLIVQPRWINGMESKALAEARSDADEDEEEDEDEDEEEQHDSAPASATPAASAPDAGAGDDDDDDAGSDELPSQESGPLASLIESDPLAVRYGVRQSYLPQSNACLAKRKERARLTRRAKGTPASSCPAPIAECDAQNFTHLVAPGTSHTLEMETNMYSLVAMPGAPAPLWSDIENTSVRVYGEGKGRVVMLATSYFDNARLQSKDHAELLLALTALNGAARHVTIVKYLDMQPWWQLLWDRFYMLMLGACALLVLVLWAALRRFGPLLPEPAGTRRSLMEHIDASGAWLWKADGGRQVLLDAARAETLALVRRRVPAMMRLPATELTAALAAAAGLSPVHVHDALYGDAASHQQQFTRQIRTLQTLRNHHER
jgi:hypothetical protein